MRLWLWVSYMGIIVGLSLCIGYKYAVDDRQYLYNKGVQDGIHYQIKQDEYLYKKIEQVNKDILWVK